MRLHPQLALIADLQFGISCQWDCHVYALRAPGGVVLIDAGSGMAHDALLGNLRQEFGTDEIAGLVLTHTHPDHANGASRFACDVYAPAASKGILEDADEERSGLAGGHRRGAYPMEMRMEACRVHRALEHGESFTVAGQTLQAIHVTGHSEDSFCYVTEMECGRALFCGDAVFYGGVLGLINAPGSSMDSYRTHLGRLRGLDVDCLFPGHGLFTFRKGQRHIDAALQQLERGFVPRMIGQQELISENFMINSKVLAKLRAGEFVRATAVGRINDAWIADLVGRIGFDALWYDLEHQTGPDHAANGMSLACRATGMDLMVRVRKGEYGSPMRMLEAGANGLMVPHIRSADEARQWVEWCRFPPLGKRGFDGAGVDADYMLATPLDHMRQANEQVFLTFQIEDREALDGIDDIAGVPGYDILFVGPGDLSISLGVPFQMDHPAMQNAIETVARAASAHGKWWGIPAGSPAAAQRYLEQGARFLAYGSDHVVLVNGFQRLREDLSGLKLP